MSLKCQLIHALSLGFFCYPTEGQRSTAGFPGVRAVTEVSKNDSPMERVA